MSVQDDFQRAQTVAEQSLERADEYLERARKLARVRAARPGHDGDSETWRADRVAALAALAGAYMQRAVLGLELEQAKVQMLLVADAQAYEIDESAMTIVHPPPDDRPTASQPDD